MFFFKPTEIQRMRYELMDHCTETYKQSRLQQFDDYVESIMTSIKSGSHFDESRTQKELADADQALEDAQRQLDIITHMSDGDIKQLYYRTFNRWHPIS